MSLQNGEVKFNAFGKKGRLALWVLGVTEFILTAAFVVVLTSNILFPDQVAATTNAVSKVLSYEGRLTDSSGNALGGTGTNYCFRFSIYNQGGTKVWPAGTPYTNTVSVVNGVFSVGIGTTTTAGQTADDLSTYNFYDDDSVYLNIEATSSLAGSCAAETSFVTLSPRQRLDAVAFARASRDVYGSLLKTINASGLVQIGTGSTGVATAVNKLVLESKTSVADGADNYVGQSCTGNGTMWYNSATSEALICEANVIEAVGTVATSTIASIAVNNASTVSVGTVVFSNGNGVSWGINGSTITARGPILSTYEPYPSPGMSTALVGIPTATSAAVSFYPFVVNQNVSAGVMNLLASVSFITVGTSSGRQTAGLMAGIFTRGVGANSATIGTLASTSFSWGVTGNNSTYSISQVTSTGYGGYGAMLQTTSAGSNISSGYTGVKHIGIPINTLLTPGNYWLGIIGTNSTSSVNVGISMSLFMGVRNTAQSAGAPFGSFSSAYSTGMDPAGGRWFPGLGTWTSAGSVTGLPASVSFASISAGLTQQPIINFWST